MTARALAGILAGLALASQAAALEVPPVRERTLPNGLTLLLAERRDVPLIAFEALLRGGAVTDPSGKEGLASLTAQMLRKGAGARGAQELADAVDGAGAILTTDSGLESFVITGRFLSSDADLMIELLSDVLRRPTFPEEEWGKLRDRTAASIVAAKDNPRAFLWDYGTGFLFGAHPYGRPVEGDEATVRALEREDLLRCYRTHFGADRMILAIVGDFDARSLERKIVAALGSWGRAPEPWSDPVPAERAIGRRVLLVNKPDATQAYFWLGNVGIERTYPDRVAVDVANTALGGRFTSLLNSALRIESGLTYGAGSRFRPYAAPGPFAISSYTKSQRTADALDLALDVYKAFRGGGIDSTLLQSVKTYIRGLHPLDYERASEIAGALAMLRRYGLTREELTEYDARVERVEESALRKAVADAFPEPENLAIVLIGNAEAIRPVARRYGPVTEISMEEPLLGALARARATPAR